MSSSLARLASLLRLAASLFLRRRSLYASSLSTSSAEDWRERTLSLLEPAGLVAEPGELTGVSLLASV
ncbi:hypothetical protein BpHYR1_018234 [Brachionus plicatilis]|uniref:Uncharacterized protein n=1 Tax=Brachionus plicatilis TaxID=10195 RepID=A0A3M7QWZ6_BRAPC|nr:hypothetical protein BpHYR1_018234 [Brachionus plicatilis]